MAAKSESSNEKLARKNLLREGGKIDGTAIKGHDFDKGVDLARAAGYNEYLLFKQRKVERTVKI